MFEVTIKINVKNHSELVEKYSQEIKNQNLEEGNINEKIEREIKKQVEEALYKSIKSQFSSGSLRTPQR